LLGKENKKFIFLALLLLLPLTHSSNFGTEIDQNVFIDETNFGYTQTVELNENFYMKLRIIDDSNNALRNYHIDFKIEDNRGVLIGDYSERILNDVRFRILSDDNGFINLTLPINQCNGIQSTFCFRPEQAYSFRIIQRNLDRTETFNVEIQTIDNDWIGNTMRWGVKNIDYIIILGFIIIIVVLGALSLLWLFFRRR